MSFKEIKDILSKAKKITVNEDGFLYELDEFDVDCTENFLIFTSKKNKNKWIYNLQQVKELIVK